MPFAVVGHTFKDRIRYARPPLLDNGYEIRLIPTLSDAVPTTKLFVCDISRTPI